jgi:hypothetical protein
MQDGRFLETGKRQQAGGKLQYATSSGFHLHKIQYFGSVDEASIAVLLQILK